VKVFIRGDIADRIETMMSRKNLSYDQARKLIKEVDKDRASYYRYYTDQVWGESENYDLIVNSSKVGIDGSVKVILSYLDAVRGKK
jgi:cytidylate kinase